ncbi:MAG: glycosyltransferase [Candidatus Hydrogenedentes bacterium]|nr:glycosyltransferase [Candidatus Hydrogenedentota bacterium]
MSQGDHTSTGAPEISVVIPIFNEEPNLRELHQRIIAALDGMGRTFEIVSVDDGSSDGSLATLKAIRAEEPRVRIVQLARNFGQGPATYAGFQYVRGSIVCMIDADLQNPPEELPKLIAKIDEGYDCASGKRTGRHESFTRRLGSRAINAIVRATTRTTVQDLGCAMKALRREVVELLVRFTHHSRYLPVDIAWLGVRMIEVDVAQHERTVGESKYGPLKLIRTTFDLVTGITSAPLQFFSPLGFTFAFIGFLMALRVLYVRFTQGDINQLSAVVAAFFVLSGVQLIATGLMCEYIARIYIEVQNRPYFVVKDVDG